MSQIFCCISCQPCFQLKGATKLQPKIIFVPATKIGVPATKKHNQHFKLPYFMKTLYFGTSNFRFTYRKMNVLLVYAFSIYLVFFSLKKPKKTCTDQSTLQVFLLCLKRKN